jgi:meiotically up-regulated gene 157 (Mug157) protein
VSFSPATDFAVGTFPLSVATGDLNGDGKPELAVTNHSDDAGLDYEPDSLAYLIFLAWSYQAASGTSRHLDEYFWKAAKAAVEVLSGSDTEGGNLHKFADGSALTKTPFRPSDDPADGGVFNIPVNAFCADYYASTDGTKRFEGIGSAHNSLGPTRFSASG